MSIHTSCGMYLRFELHVQIRLYYVLPYKAKISAQHGIGLRPKDFWSYFRTKKKGTNSEIGIDDFQTYFSELFNEIKQVNISEVNDFISSHDFNPDDCIFGNLTGLSLFQKLNQQLKS